MNRVSRLIYTGILSFLILSGCGRDDTPVEIIACGDDRVAILNYEHSDTNHLEIIWEWIAAEADDLPEIYRDEYMGYADDCKPVDGNSKLLITSSAGGVVLLDKDTKKVLFHTFAANAHSAEWLPGGRIVVALSTDDKGNALELYDVNHPGTVLDRDSLYSGHGVVWIGESEKLFALGFSELREYSLKNWNSDAPELKLEVSWEIPGYGGHDLIAVSETRLILSSEDGVWSFDIPTQEFTPFESLASVRDVKSINYNEESGLLIYTKAEISWWTHHIYGEHLKGEQHEKTLTIPETKLYKVRVVR